MKVIKPNAGMYAVAEYGRNGAIIVDRPQQWSPVTAPANALGGRVDVLVGDAPMRQIQSGAFTTSPGQTQVLTPLYDANNNRIDYNLLNDPLYLAADVFGGKGGSGNPGRIPVAVWNPNNLNLGAPAAFQADRLPLLPTTIPSGSTVMLTKNDMTWNWDWIYQTYSPGALWGEWDDMSGTYNPDVLPFWLIVWWFLDVTSQMTVVGDTSGTPAWQGLSAAQGIAGGGAMSFAAPRNIN